MESYHEVKAAFLEPTSTLSTIVEYHDILLPMVANIVDEMVEQGPSRCSKALISRVSLALLKALNLLPQLLEREVVLYFSVFPAPANLCSCDDNSGLDIYDCAESTLLGLYESNELCHLWQWYDLVPFIELPDERVRWFGMKAMGLILGVNIAPVDMDNDRIQVYEMIWKETLAKQYIYRNRLYKEKLASHDNIHSSDRAMSTISIQSVSYTHLRAHET